MLTVAHSAKKYGIKPLKKYGQNFIFDLSLCKKIVKHSLIPPFSNVLEIGPGTAGLTRAILETNPSRLTVIEKDQRFFPLLRELQNNYSSLSIIEADALKFDINTLKYEKIHIISNLPYNIGTILLVKWLKQVDFISSITVMLQKEVAARVAASTDSKEYGRLSVLCAVICNIKKCFDVSRKAFYPSPKVESSVIRLTPKDNIPSLKTIKVLEELTNLVFSKRRKTLKSSLKSTSFKNAALKLNIDLSLRPEKISPDQFLNLANFSLEMRSNID